MDDFLGQPPAPAEPEKRDETATTPPPPPPPPPNPGSITIGNQEIPGSNPNRSLPEQEKHWKQIQDWYREYWKNLGGMTDIYAEDDLVRGDAARNLTGKTAEETIRLSRLADMMNNTRYLSPSDIGYGGHGTYGAGTHAQAIQHGTPYQMPIETEEMRQAAEHRRRQTALNEAEMARQQEAKNLPIRPFESEAMERMSRERHAWEMAHDEPYRRNFETFQTNLKLLSNVSAATFIMRAYISSPTLANLLANIFGVAAGMPNPLQHLFANATNGIMADVEAGRLEEKEAIAKMLREWVGILGDSIVSLGQGGKEELDRIIGMLNQ